MGPLVFNGSQRTRATLKALGNFGLLKRRRRLPQQVYPSNLERAYAAAITERLIRLRRVYDDFFRQLPALLASAAQDRRLDAGESRTVLEEFKRIRARLEDLTDDELDDLTALTARRVAAYQREQLNRQLLAGLGAALFIRDRAIPRIVDNFTSTNASLIGGIANATANRVETLVQKAIQDNTPAAVLTEAIDKQLSGEASRAANLARDQIGKLYGQVNTARQKDAGVERFVWVTMRDDRVRDEHVARDGVTYRYDDPPDGELPGEPPNCRCHAEPVLSDLTGEPDAV